MKKRYIAAIIIPLILAFILAGLMTPSSTDVFMSKMKIYLDSENVCSQFAYKVDGDRYKVNQCKAGENYYMAFKSSSGADFLINIVGDDVYAGKDDAVLSFSKSTLSEEGSVILLDKISVSDINKDSVKRDKEAEGLFYDFELNDGTKMAAHFEMGKLKELIYKEKEVVPHVSLAFADSQTGRCSVYYSNWDFESGLKEEYKLPAGVKKVAVEDLMRPIDEESEPELMGLKNNLGLRDWNSDFEDYGEEEEEFVEEEEGHSHGDFDETEDNPDFEELDF